MGGVAHFTPPIGKEFILKKVLCVFLSVLVVASFLALGASAEEVLDVRSGGSRSFYSPSYVLVSSGVTSFYSWLVSEGYSSSSYFTFSDDVYLYASGHGVTLVEYVYPDRDIIFAYCENGTTYQIVTSLRSLAFDSVDLYSWFLHTVGLDYSDFSYGSEVVSVVGASQAIAGSVFDVGGSILSFVTSSWITVIALVAFVLVLGFGVIRRFVKGV